MSDSNSAQIIHENSALKYSEAESTKLIRQQLSFMIEILDLIGYDKQDAEPVVDFLALAIESLALSKYFENLPPEGKLKVEVLNKNYKEITPQDLEQMRGVFENNKIENDVAMKYYEESTREVLGEYLGSVVLMVGPRLKEKIKQIFESKFPLSNG